MGSTNAVVLHNVYDAICEITREKRTTHISSCSEMRRYSTLSCLSWSVKAFFPNWVIVLTILYSPVLLRFLSMAETFFQCMPTSSAEPAVSVHPLGIKPVSSSVIRLAHVLVSLHACYSCGLQMNSINASMVWVGFEVPVLQGLWKLESIPDSLIGCYCLKALKQM